MQYLKKHKERNATRIHIQTPLFNYWQKYGGKEGEWYLGLNKKLVDYRAELDGIIDLTWFKHEQIKCIKATEIQKYPIELIKGSDVEVYIIPCRILRKQENTN